MKAKRLIHATMLACLGCSMSARAAVHYVNVNSASPTPPYTNWATAAATIQDAVDVARAGDEIVVTNGVYQTGGRAVYPGMTNRVAVTKPLRVRSVNGPDWTSIQGSRGITNGPGAIRCVYLTNDATLVGFRLEFGAVTRTSPLFEHAGHEFLSGGGVWSESESARISNCVLYANSASYGGGAYWGTLYNCTLVDNTADSGGGAMRSVLVDCLVTGNSAGRGGAVYYSTLLRCTLGSNYAIKGGALSASWATNCVITNNTAAQLGGGAISTSLNNCLLAGNSAELGGGTHGSHLRHCTVTENTARSQGGGVWALGGMSVGPPYFCESAGCWPNPGCNPCDTGQSEIFNSIIYQNTAPEGSNHFGFTGWGSNFYGGTITSSCTTPLPTNNIGNISDAPQFVNSLIRNFRLRADSPCVNAGLNEFATSGTDLDGRTRIIGGTVDLGTYEFDTVVHYVQVNNANATPPYTNWATAAATIQDAVDVARAGDEIVVTNGVYQTGVRGIDGVGPNRVAVTKPLTVRSVNGPEVTVIRGDQENQIRCVYLISGGVLAGFTLTNGAAAPDPLSVIGRGGGVCSEGVSAVVSDCIIRGNSAYAGGGAFRGTLNHCALTGNHAKYGGGALDSILTQCVLSNNAALFNGGGACSSPIRTPASAGVCVLNNCTLAGNSAGDNGGGSYACTVNNSALTGNSARRAGGAYAGTLNNCTLIANAATEEGGGFWSHSQPCDGCPPLTLCDESGCGPGPGTLNNCVVYLNTAGNGPNYFGGTLNYSCTTPLPTNGIGNITNQPAFVDFLTGNLRLQSNSPCINAGRNAYALTGPDLDGNPRNVGGTVDIGAYEFQSPQTTLSYAWLQQYGLPIDGSVDFADPDVDGLNNWQEWRTGTVPTNSLSALRLLAPVPGTSDVVIRWQSVLDRTYFLERHLTLGTQSSFEPLASNIAGQAGMTAYTITNAAGTGPYFYRVGVNE